MTRDYPCVAIAALCLVGCAWARATFSDPPGPITCTPREGFDCIGGALVPYGGARPRPHPADASTP